MALLNARLLMGLEEMGLRLLHLHLHGLFRSED